MKLLLNVILATLGLSILAAVFVRVVSGDSLWACGKKVTEVLPESHYHYQEKVEIIQGFYTGYTGRIIGYREYEDNYIYIIKLSDDQIVDLTPDYLRRIH